MMCSPELFSIHLLSYKYTEEYVVLYIRSLYSSAIQGLPIKKYRIKSILSTVAEVTSYNLVLTYLFALLSCQQVQRCSSHRAFVCVVHSAQKVQCQSLLHWFLTFSSQPQIDLLISLSQVPSLTMYLPLLSPLPISFESHHLVSGKKATPLGFESLLHYMLPKLLNIFALQVSHLKNEDNDSTYFIDCFETKWVNICKTPSTCDYVE